MPTPAHEYLFGDKQPGITSKFGRSPANVDKLCPGWVKVALESDTFGSTLPGFDHTCTESSEPLTRHAKSRDTSADSVNFEQASPEVGPKSAKVGPSMAKVRPKAGKFGQI